ncbi:MAG: hypothetical protein Q8R31_02935 [Candidatus Omnitrophota bacterium]|nr:hypothetical protein [Candidatus Omnitrophota bacterium]
MRLQRLSWNNSIFLGFLTGIVWGWVAIGVNAISGAFIFENDLLHNLVTFTIGGAVFGIVVGALLSLSHDWLPFKNIFLKTVFLSVILWGVLMIGGIVLSTIEPERYHLVVPQTVQGFVLAIIMGGLLGFLLKVSRKYN